MGLGGSSLQDVHVGHVLSLSFSLSLSTRPPPHMETHEDKVMMRTTLTEMDTSRGRAETSCDLIGWIC